MAANQESMTPLKRFWGLLKSDSEDIRNVYIYSIFKGLVNLSLPLGIQAIINLIQGGQMSTSWVVLIVFVVLGTAITGVLQIFQLRITENLQRKVFARAAFEFAFRLPRIKMEALYKHYAPELVNRFFDTISVQKGLPKILIDFSTAIIQAIFGLILLSFYHPFFIAFSLVLVLLVFAIFRFTARRGLETSLIESKYKYKVAHWLEELARTSLTFKLAGKTSFHLHRTDKDVSGYLDAREKHFQVLVRQYSLLVVVKVIVAMGLLAIGGILVMQQLMNIGQFVAAEIIILLVIDSVEKLILSLDTAYDVLTSLEKIAQVTDLELEDGAGLDMEKECDAPGLAVALEDLSFTYPSSNFKALNQVDLTINKGEKWVITGSNHSGKSTLLHVLAGLFEVQEGVISYNDLPKGNLELITLRSVIGDLLSEEQLFDGTVLDNISMGRQNASFENVKWAVHELGLDGFVRSLPQGYNTYIDPLGKKLPGSIIQKLLIARSIADRPKLLLLEDAFEHIDEADKREIIDFLTSKKNGWTMVAVSSDPYLMAQSDKIAVMEKGRIINVDSTDYPEIVN